MSIRDYMCWEMLPIVLTCCTSAYLTSLLCRFAQWRHWKLRLGFGFIGAIGAVSLTALFVWLGLSIQHGAVGQIVEEYLRSRLLVVSAFALAPALLVAWYYRRRLRQMSGVKPTGTL